MLYRLSYTGEMVGMPGLEPGNPEGADLQSAAVAAVPHPHSVFKPLARCCRLQAKGNIRPTEKLVNLIPSNPPSRAYPYHQTFITLRTCQGDGPRGTPRHVSVYVGGVA